MTDRDPLAHQTDLIEQCAKAVHSAYCDNHIVRKGVPYWTGGDYSKLDEETKEIDRATVRAVLCVVDARLSEARAEIERLTAALATAEGDLLAFTTGTMRLTAERDALQARLDEIDRRRCDSCCFFTRLSEPVHCKDGACTLDHPWKLTTSGHGCRAWQPKEDGR